MSQLRKCVTKFQFVLHVVACNPVVDSGRLPFFSKSIPPFHLYSHPFIASNNKRGDRTGTNGEKKRQNSIYLSPIVTHRTYVDESTIHPLETRRKGEKGYNTGQAPRGPVNVHIQTRPAIFPEFLIFLEPPRPLKSPGELKMSTFQKNATDLFLAPEARLPCDLRRVPLSHFHRSLCRAISFGRFAPTKPNTMRGSKNGADKKKFFARNPRFGRPLPGLREQR